MYAMRQEFFQRVICQYLFGFQQKLKEILNKVKKAIKINNPDYDIVIKRLYLYYDMKLVTFGINRDTR